MAALPASQPGRVPGLVVRQAGSNNNVGDEAVPDEDLRAVEVEQALAEDATIPISEGAAGAIPAESAIGDVAESAIGDAFTANRGVPDENVLHFGLAEDDVDDLVNTGAAVSFGNGHFEGLATENIAHDGLEQDDFATLGLAGADEALVDVVGA